MAIDHSCHLKELIFQGVIHRFRLKFSWHGLDLNNQHVSTVKNCPLLFNDYQIKLLFWRNGIEWKMYFTIREKIMKQFFLIRHNCKYKLSKGENGCLRFVHDDVELFLFGWLMELFHRVASKIFKNIPGISMIFQAKTDFPTIFFALSMIYVYQ